MRQVQFLVLAGMLLLPAPVSVESARAVSPSNLPGLQAAGEITRDAYGIAHIPGAFISIIISGAMCQTSCRIHFAKIYLSDMSTLIKSYKEKDYTYELYRVERLKQSD